MRPSGSLDTQVIPDSGTLGFVLYGDSHAGQYFPAATARFGPGALVSENGCLSADGVMNWDFRSAKGRICKALPDTLVELVQARKIPTVIWAQRWDRELYDSASGKPLGRSTDASLPAMLAAISRTIARLPVGTRVIIIGNSPTAWAAGEQMQGGWLRCRAYRNVTCADSYPAARAEGREVTAKLRAFAARDPRLTFIDAAAPLCDGTRCWLIQNGRLNYWDGSHMTPTAAARVIAQIDPAPILP